jgi:hypothetical protein
VTAKCRTKKSVCERGSSVGRGSRERSVCV